MTFRESVGLCFGPKYFFRFAGRASRSEFWWAMLFIGLVNMAAGLVGMLLPPMLAASLSLVVSLLLLPANLGVTVRRFHDRGLSGWWLLIPIVMVGIWAASGGAYQAENPVGATLMLAMSLGYLIILCMPGTAGPNRYGPDPRATRDTAA